MINKFKHFYTSFRSSINTRELWFDYDKTLAEIGLAIDTSDWVAPCLGDFCQLNGMLSEDNFHPSGQGHEKWTNEILIPYLTDKAILQ